MFPAQEFLLILQAESKFSLKKKTLSSSHSSSSPISGAVGMNPTIVRNTAKKILPSQVLLNFGKSQGNPRAAFPMPNSNSFPHVICKQVQHEVKFSPDSSGTFFCRLLLVFVSTSSCNVLYAQNT